MPYINDLTRSQFDPDIRDIVKVRLVHGSWRREDVTRMHIDDATRRFSNVEALTAYLPDPYGTHHTKMIILFRHDDLAQVIIMTANLIRGDWVMSQAIWKSPLLRTRNPPSDNKAGSKILGTGSRFQKDLTAYLKSYGSKLKDLITQLNKHDFNEVRGALIASTPGKQYLSCIDPESTTTWGWFGLKNILRSISPAMESEFNGPPHIVIQVSSVASVGESWLKSTLLPALSTIKPRNNNPRASSTTRPPKPKFSIIFPTAPEIRRTHNGYAAGPSIHMKLHTPAQAKQLTAIRPMLCHWAGRHAILSPPPLQADPDGESPPIREAYRSRAAPHIKTYIRFSDASMTKIDWAMVTSANLSTQAWGSAVSPGGEVKVQSYELGVVVWPALWDDPPTATAATSSLPAGAPAVRSEMVPTFGTNTPTLPPQDAEQDSSEKSPTNATATATAPVTADKDKDKEKKKSSAAKRLIGWRMPYDLPLIPYNNDEMPWCASQPDAEPDCKGRVWLYGT